MNRPILSVTRPLLPPLEEFQPYLEAIWASGQVTNGGPFERQLEAAVMERLGVENVTLTANGTIALLLAIRAMELQGEVITTPFSFVATTHALRWSGIVPVFADIDPVNLSLDPAAVDAAIGPRTSAILPVHVYGRPCDDALDRLARARGLGLLYDAAHAFGVRTDQPIAARGDMAIFSFHATKVFHTFEGGAVVSASAEMKRCLDRMRNFGYVSETEVVAVGINGKMNELQAAFGLLHLRHLDDAIGSRARIDAIYRAGLAGIEGIACLPEAALGASNFGFFPVRVGERFPAGRDGLYRRLRDAGIHARRYFFPLISDFAMYRDAPSARPDNLPIARQVAKEILCLPIFPQMGSVDCERIVGLIRRCAAD
jgi:dTDP-4-amino-4,6-dideoxygalactose transaminase